MRTLTALATTTILALAAESAVAQVFKCTVNGRQVYQSKPCAAGDKPVEIYSHPTADGPVRSGGESNFQEYLDSREDKNRRVESELDRRAREAKNNRLAKEASEAERQRMKRAVLDDKVLPGMSMQQVRDSWGKPEDVNRRIHSDGSRSERWDFKTKDGWDFVYFRDGQVSHVSQNN